MSGVVMVVCIAWHAVVDEDRSPELAARALTIAPRVRLEPARGLLWADARDLDARGMVTSLLELVDQEEYAGARAGVATTPIAALVAARAGPQPDSSARLTLVPPGTDRAFLAPFDVGVLDPPPPPSLYPLLAAVGIARVGELAQLDRESIEVRFGAEGMRLWQLARADDPRLLFASRPRDLPHAQLEWVDYELDRQEQVLFIVHSLLGTVCDALAARGEGGHAMALEFALANRTVVRHPVRSSQPTADRRIWLRVIRATLERVTFDAPVTRIALGVEGAAPLADRQGDLFDAGFATAQATEAALAHLLDKQHDALAVATRTRHPLVEHRLTWVADPAAADRFSTTATVATPTLSLQLLGAPRPIAVRTEPRQDGAAPTRYRDGSLEYPLAEALGPDRVSGGFGGARFDREYFQGVRADGMVVLLYRDVTENQWFLGGWWD